ncbi:Molybdopterin molybdenumtransferase [Streptomyces sp. RB5]|uniref:Molybdopterin molybdenumtransferase n=1 Tax=Streptomyces smaragdinus TaxID=2585196 RepID=A0A7K0CB73_9ACTN|nr:molybdopterin-binding protein [Streptomyces smaragdinus]MQY10623.1 Molybdopterin molybdenumtransferase [Streptomyces smaragdinus]
MTALHEPATRRHTELSWPLARALAAGAAAPLPATAVPLRRARGLALARPLPGADGELLPAGTVLTPAALGLAASTGHDTLTVHGRPLVAVLITGNRPALRRTPPPGRPRDATGPVLRGLIDWAGGRALPATHLPDGVRPLADALVRAARDTDAIAVYGASSPGPADRLGPALDSLGAQVVVDGVACRPGRPQLLARLRCGTPVVGLPGDPYAAPAAGVTLLAPLLAALAGRTPPAPRYVRLDTAVGAHRADTRLVPVTSRGARVVAVGHDRPGLPWAAALGDALAVVPPGGAELVELIELPR